MDKMTEISIATLPKQVFPSFWLRAGAFIIDAIVLVVANFLILFSIQIIAINSDYLYAGQVIANIAMSAFVMMYFIVMHKEWSATLGKMACKMKVIKFNGQPLAYKDAVMRLSPFIAVKGITLLFSIHYFIFTYPEMPTVAGPLRLYNVLPAVCTIWVIASVLWIFINRYRRTLHDLISEPSSLKSDPMQFYPSLASIASKYDGFLDLGIIDDGMNSGNRWKWSG